MRTFIMALFVLLTAVPAFAQFGPADKMGGTGRSKQIGKSCSAYANVCVLNNPAAKDKCESARANCMATGTFKGPKGSTFSGMLKQ
jgi:hypothetical protein